jgi:uncharacterized protein with gpF-like domain
MPKTPRQLYVAKLNDIAQRYGNIEDATARAIVEELQDARRHIDDVVLRGPDDMTQARLSDVRREVDAIVAEFERQATNDIRAAIEAAYRNGAQAVAQPLAAIGVPGSFARPSLAQLNALLDYSAELVTGITANMRQAVNQELRNAGLGVQSQFQAMQNLTKRFGDVQVEQGRRVASGISAKAETVVRTELQTVFNVAEHSQQLVTAQQVSGLLKRWIATSDSRTRKGHLDAHNRYRTDPIPVTEKFEVFNLNDDWQRTGSPSRAMMMYPGDPSAPGWARINCRCRMATIHPAVGVIGGPLDGIIASMIGGKR